MNFLLLENLPLTGNPSDMLGSLLGPLIGFFVALVLVGFGAYIYFSLAYSKIGSKVKLSSPGIAWMPGTGPLAIIFEASKMHWWPFLVATTGFLLGYLLMFFGLVSSAMATLGGVILLVSMLILAVMSLVWHWKTYEAVKKPGWWALVPVVAAIISFGLIATVSAAAVGVMLLVIGAILHLIFIGIAAWG